MSVGRIEAKEHVYGLLKSKFEYEPNEYEKLNKWVRAEVENLCVVRKCNDCGRTFVSPYLSPQNYAEMQKDFSTIIRCEDCYVKYDAENERRYSEEKNRRYSCSFCNTEQKHAGTCYTCLHTYGRHSEVEIVKETIEVIKKHHGKQERKPFKLLRIGRVLIWKLEKLLNILRVSFSSSVADDVEFEKQLLNRWGFGKEGGIDTRNQVKIFSLLKWLKDNGY